MHWPTALAILRKELRETLRDTRTIGAMIILPMVLYPALMIAMDRVVSGMMAAEKGKKYRIVLAHPENLAGLAEFVARQPNLTVVSTDQPEKALATGKVQVVVSGSPTFAPDLAAGRTARVRLLFDASRDTSRMALRRVQEAVRSYSDRVLAERLAIQGLPRAFARPLETKEQNVASPARMGAHILAIVLPMMVIILATTSAFYPAIDLTAGERERGTLETLLASPAGRREIVLGKYLTVVAVAGIAAVVNMLSMSLVFAHGMSLTGDMPEALNIRIPYTNLAWCVPIVLLVLALVAAVMITVALACTSFKDAQNVLTPLYLLIMLPSMVTMSPTLKLTYGWALVPISNVALLMRQALEGHKFTGPAAVAVAATTLYAALALRSAVRAFGREEIVSEQWEPLSLEVWKALVRRRAGVPRGREVVGLVAAVFLLLFYAGPSMVKGSAFGLPGGMVTVELACVLLPALAFIRALGGSPSGVFRCRWAPGEALAGGLLAGAGVSVFGVAAALVMERWWPSPPGRWEHLERAMTLLQGRPWEALLAVAVVPAVCEEVLFRGVVLAGLQPGRRPVTAVVVSSLLFGLSHPNLEQFVPATLMGLALGALALRSGSIVPGIVAHATINTLGFFAWGNIFGKGGLPLGEQAQLLLLLAVLAVPCLWLGMRFARNPRPWPRTA